MDPLGTQLRRQRRKLALSLDDVAKLTGISKPYLSLVETNKTKSPPSDEKLRRLEQTLKFAPGSLVVRAHLARTPSDVRDVLQHLLSRPPHPPSVPPSPPDAPPADAPNVPKCPRMSHFENGFGINLDEAYLSGALQSLVEERSGNAHPLPVHEVPLINKVSAGYPRDFTDLDYPARVADEYTSVPLDPLGSLGDAVRHSFAARVHGDSMLPRYLPGDIVIFSPTPDPTSGSDCFVRLTSGQTTFKRVYFDTDPQGNPAIRLQPLNPKYPPKTLPPEKIAALYRAVYVTRPVT